MVFDEVRGRVLRYLLFAAVAGGLGWGIFRATPRWRETERLAAAVARIEGQTLQARDEAIRMGGEAMEDSIAAARVRFEALRDRVPAGREAMGAAEIREVITALAEREGVTIRRDEPLAWTREGAFEVSGLRLRLVSSYHALGAWMTGILSVPRLVEFREISMRVEPDSLLAAAKVEEGPSSSAPGSLPASGAAPREEAGRVVTELSLVWFREAPPESAPPSDTTANRGR